MVFVARVSVIFGAGVGFVVTVGASSGVGFVVTVGASSGVVAVAVGTTFAVAQYPL